MYVDNPQNIDIKKEKIQKLLLPLMKTTAQIKLIIQATKSNLP